MSDDTKVNTGACRYRAVTFEATGTHATPTALGLIAAMRVRNAPARPVDEPSFSRVIVPLG